MASILASLMKLSIVLAAAAVHALPAGVRPRDWSLRLTHLKPRTKLAYDQIVGFVQTVPSDTEGNLYLAYQPFLKVVNGCVPFPAVNGNGDISRGLPRSGLDGNSACTRSPGQIYARAAWHGDHYGIMYAWYMPKDEPSFAIGHVHDWEGVIIWVRESGLTSAANIVAVCPSAHGRWACATHGYTLAATGAAIAYASRWPWGHSCRLTTVLGGQQPLVAYESLPGPARAALEFSDFGRAIVPFIDATFQRNLGKATF